MEPISWDDYFMSMAYLVAMRSKDKSSHVGAVITTPDHRLVSTGYNGYPRGTEYGDKKRAERPEKYLWTVHAEVNAITLSERRPEGCTLYCTAFSCAPCCHAVIQAGIVEVVTDLAWNEVMDPEGTDWAEQAKRVLPMFKNAGVKHRVWRGKLIQPVRFLKGGIVK